MAECHVALRVAIEDDVPRHQGVRSAPAKRSRNGSRLGTLARPCSRLFAGDLQPGAEHARDRDDGLQLGVHLCGEESNPWIQLSRRGSSSAMPPWASVRWLTWNLNCRSRRRGTH